jgi:hypothetical protein
VFRGQLWVCVLRASTPLSPFIAAAVRPQPTGVLRVSYDEISSGHYFAFFAIVRPMPMEEYEKHLIISRPDHRRDNGIWLAGATVTWQDGSGFHYHQFSDIDELFDTEQEAVAFGFTIARAWIDKRL